MNNNEFPTISIIFSNYNGGKEPLECLASINKLNYPKNKIETIVIDNGSKDKSPEKIAGRFPQVNLIKLKKDIGLPASLNLGIKKSRGAYIFIANDDIILEKNSIKEMVKFLKTNKDVAIVGGKIFNKEKPQMITQSVCGFNFYLGTIKTPKNKFDPKEVQWLQSCAIMVPAEIFKKIGLFDGGFYPLYFDDFDICLRAKRAGFKIAYLPKAIFWHGVGKTTSKYPGKTIYYWWYKNKIRFLLKNANFIQIITCLTIQFPATTFESIKSKQLILPMLFKALFENILTMPQILKLRHAKNQLRR